MNLKEKVLLGIYSSIGLLDIANDYLLQKTSLYDGDVRKFLTCGYINELITPFSMYFMMKVALGHEPKSIPISRPFNLFLLFGFGEFLQKGGFPGVYDERDFLAYGVSLATAVIVDRLSFSQLEETVNDEIIRKNK